MNSICGAFYKTVCFLFPLIFFLFPFPHPLLPPFPFFLFSVLNSQDSLRNDGAVAVVQLFPRLARNGGLGQAHSPAIQAVFVSTEAGSFTRSFSHSIHPSIDRLDGMDAYPHSDSDSDSNSDNDDTRQLTLAGARPKVQGPTAIILPGSCHTHQHCASTDQSREGKEENAKNPDVGECRE